MGYQLEHHLKEINKKVCELHEVVIDVFMSSMKSFELLDQNMASETKEMSKGIEELSQRIEDNVFETIARRQPVARDLRQLATYLQVAHHLYRIGRYAYKIVARLARETINKAMLGILQGDLSEIDELEKLEADSDRETGEMFEEITEYLRKKKGITTMAMYYVIVGRYCERAADHAFSIAERAVYMVTGEKKKLGLAYKGSSSETPH
jgi:phosphate transport system protein